MLKRIHNTREKLLGSSHIATGEAKYILVRGHHSSSSSVNYYDLVFLSHLFF